MTQPVFESPYNDMLRDLEHRVVIQDSQRPIPIPATDGCTNTCVTCDTCTCSCLWGCEGAGEFPTPLPGGGVIDPGGGVIRPGF